MGALKLNKKKLLSLYLIKNTYLSENIYPFDSEINNIDL